MISDLSKSDFLGLLTRHYDFDGGMREYYYHQPSPTAHYCTDEYGRNWAFSFGIHHDLPKSEGDYPTVNVEEYAVSSIRHSSPVSHWHGPPKENHDTWIKNLPEKITDRYKLGWLSDGKAMLSQILAPYVPLLVPLIRHGFLGDEQVFMARSIWKVNGRKLYMVYSEGAEKPWAAIEHGGEMCFCTGTPDITLTE